MSGKKNKGVPEVGSRSRSWKVYYLGKLFKECEIKHSKPTRPIYSVYPGAFVTRIRRSGGLRKKPVPMSQLGEVVTGARHILRQEERHKFDFKHINRAWNRFNLLRNLPDTQEIAYQEAGRQGKLIMQPGQVLFTGKTLPESTFIPIQAVPEHLRKLHRNIRKKGLRKHLIIPAPGAYEHFPYKVEVVPIWIGPQFGLPSLKGTLKEEYFHTLPHGPNYVVRRTWKGPPFSDYYRSLVNRMRRFRSKLLEKVVYTAVDSQKKLKKRRFIAKCTRKAIRAMQLFTLAGHLLRSKLLSILGEAKYRMLRRITRIMRRRQTKFIAWRDNLRHHARLKRNGERRSRKRKRKRLVRERARARLGPRPPGLNSPYFRKPRKARPVRLVYRSRPGKEASYVTIDEAKRVNLGKLKPRALINNRKLKRTLSLKTSPAWVKGSKRMSRANKTG